MANFPGLKLTDAGKTLQAKAQTGQALSFTRVGLGDGAAPETPAALTALVNEQHSLSIQSQDAPGDGTVTLRVIMTNQGLETGFFMRELGIFATDPDTGDEVLYSYSNAGEETDFLPAAGGAVVWEGVFDVITIVGNAENVTAVIDDYITIALKSEVDALAPYVLPKAGTVGQLPRKASNSEGDVEWFDPELDGLDVRLASVEEPRVAVAGQQVFTLQDTVTNGLAVYVNGQRLSRQAWTVLGSTQLRLADPLDDGDRVLFVNNEEAGPARNLSVSLDGPTLVYPGQSNTYTLSDFDAFAVYAVSTTVGTVSRDGATITLDVPSGVTDETLDLEVTRDNVRAAFRVAIGDAAIATPEITYPANAATGVDFEPDLSATSFVVYPEDYDDHVSTQWQVATDSGFTAIVFDSGDDTANLAAINLGAQGVRLESATRYYVRARFKGATLTSPWSATSYFNTALIYVRQPRVTSPTDGETDLPEQPTFQSDAFSVYGATDAHAATDWRLLDAAGNTVWQSLNDATHLTSIVPPKGVLQEGQTEYQLEVRYHGDEYGTSTWSPAISFVTADVFEYVVAPAVTAPVPGATDVPESPVLESSAFTTYPAGVDAHAATDWRLMDGDGVLVWQSLDDATNLTSIVIPAGVLAEATTYTLQVRHQGSALPASEWGSASFTTVATFIPQDGNAGQPFGGGYFVRRMFDTSGAEYALILSAKAEGESYLTMDEGYTSFAEGLSIGGHTDWVVPSIDELRILYRAFKPTTESNDTSSGATDRVDPPLANYTNSDPAQTSLPEFQYGGNEAFEAGFYWHDDNYRNRFTNGSEWGYSNSASYVRAVRRVYL